MEEIIELFYRGYKHSASDMFLNSSKEIQCSVLEYCWNKSLNCFYFFLEL